MARIKGKDIYLKADDQIYFGDSQEAALWFDSNELMLNHTISGVDPIADYHLVTKNYMTSSGVIDHGQLAGRADDDHLQYVPTNGSRGFTSTVSGVEPIEANDLTPRDYVIGLIDGSIPVPTPSGEEPPSLIQFSYAIDLTESSTNSTTYQQKLRLTVSGIPSGNYRIAWSYDWRESKANNQFLARVQVDDTDEIFTYVASPYVDVNYWSPVATFYYYENLVSGTHYIDMDYASSSTGATAYIKNTKIEFWRIQ